MSELAERLLAGTGSYTDGGIVGTRAGLLREAATTIDELQKRIGELEAERDDAHAIVSRVWKALGISTYADAQGKAIDEIVADLLKSHKQQLAERREEELREDERLGKTMARAEAAEQALTAERQRNDELTERIARWQSEATKWSCLFAKERQRRAEAEELLRKFITPWMYEGLPAPPYEEGHAYFSRHPSSSGNEPG